MSARLMNHKQYMKKALDEAEKALSENEFPVGCVIAGPNGVVATGSRTGTRGTPNEIDHAEITALANLIQGNTIIDKSQMVLFTTLEPCLMCFGAIILSGIKTIVYAYEDAMGGAASCDISKLSPLYANSGITIISNIMRKESLDLFQTYFTNPNNEYWRGSLLAEYTLNQSAD